ncbi:hypothetical protein JCM9533A_64360 [Catenuloplanes niger JCM 9533]
MCREYGGGGGATCGGLGGRECGGASAASTAAGGAVTAVEEPGVAAVVEGPGVPRSADRYGVECRGPGRREARGGRSGVLAEGGGAGDGGGAGGVRAKTAQRVAARWARGRSA